MAHLASILFFLGLLAALGAILESQIRTHWAAIAGALLWVPEAPIQGRGTRSARSALPVARRRWSAAS